MLIHQAALELVRLTADEEAAPALTGLNVEPTGHVTASNGYCYLRIAAKVEQPSLFDEQIPVADRNQRETVVIPGEAASQFLAALKKRKHKKDQPLPSVIVSQEGDQIRLASADGKTTRRIDALKQDLAYPDVATILKKHVTTFDVVFGVELLIDYLRVLKACGARSIHLHFPAENVSPVRVTASTEVGSIEGAVMPQRV